MSSHNSTPTAGLTSQSTGSNTGNALTEAQERLQSCENGIVASLDFLGLLQSNSAHVEEMSGGLYPARSYVYEHVEAELVATIEELDAVLHLLRQTRPEGGRPEVTIPLYDPTAMPPTFTPRTVIIPGMANSRRRHLATHLRKGGRA